MTQPVPVPFLDQFAALRDPRQAAKVFYPLPELLLLLFCGTVAGAGDFVELTLWGHEHLTFLRRFLPFAQGIPSHDTLCEVIAAIDPALFKTCFTNWVERLRLPGPETIAIDGKTSRRSHAETFGRVVQSHWGIENRLHWTLDVVFHDDLARLRTGYGPANMAVVKHIALNLLRQAKPMKA